MTSARSSTASTAHNHTPYSSRLRSRPASTRPNYADDDSDLDRAIDEHDPSPKPGPSQPKSRARTSALSAGSKRRRSSSDSSSTVSDLDSDSDGAGTFPPEIVLNTHGVASKSSHITAPTSPKRATSMTEGNANGKKRKENPSMPATDTDTDYGEPEISSDSTDSDPCRDRYFPHNTMLAMMGMLPKSCIPPLPTKAAKRQLRAERDERIARKREERRAEKPRALGEIDSEEEASFTPEMDLTTDSSLAKPSDATIDTSPNGASSTAKGQGKPKKRRQNLAQPATGAGSVTGSAAAVAAAAAESATASAITPAQTKPSRKRSTPTTETVEIPPRPQTLYLFEKSGAKLSKDETLVADDGTTFSRNGRW